MKKLAKYILLAMIIVTLSNTLTAFGARFVPIQKPDSLPGIDEELQLDKDGKLATRNILTERILPRFALGTIGFVGALSILFLIIGGIRFATAYGEEEPIESAKRQVTWSLVGLLLAVLSYTIVSIIVNLDFGEVKTTTTPSENFKEVPGINPDTIAA
jgi:amino acid transporter